MFSAVYDSAAGKKAKVAVQAQCAAFAQSFESISRKMYLFESLKVSGKTILKTSRKIRLVTKYHFKLGDSIFMRRDTDKFMALGYILIFV